MRKVLVISLIFLCLACSDWLDIKPKNFVDSDMVLKSRENILAALTGCYDALQLQNYYGRSLIIAADLLTDNSIAKGTKIELLALDENRLTPDNLIVEGIWEDIYTAINRANYLLSKLYEIDFLSQTEKQDILGQLYFLRALHYFNLVRLYGGIPLKISPTISNDPLNFLPRSTMGNVYAQIIADLDSSESLITNTQTHLATRRAVKTLKSLVFLTIGDYSASLFYANQCLNENSYLESDYGKLFGSYTEPSSEIIFYIPFTPSDKSRLAEYHFPNQLGGRYENAPSPKILSMFETQDKRKRWVAETLVTPEGSIFYTKKFPNLSTGANNVPVFRNADLFFIRAEALYKLDSVANFNAILEDINSIRQRAGLNEVSVDNASGHLWSLIEDEKQLEFAFEGKRWFDLIRTGRALNKIPTLSHINYTLFPIPLSEILYNPKIDFNNQNPGY